MVCVFFLGTYRRHASLILLPFFGRCHYPCHPCHPTSILPHLCSMFSLCFCCRIASYNWECEIPSAVGVKKASTNLQPVQRHDWTDSLPTFPNNIMLRVFVEATKFATGTDVHLKLQNVSDVPEIWPWHSLLLIPAHHFTGLLWLWKAISYMNTKQIIKYIRYSMIFLVCLF